MYRTCLLSLLMPRPMLCVSTNSNSGAMRDKYVPDRTPQVDCQTTVSNGVSHFHRTRSLRSQAHPSLFPSPSLSLQLLQMSIVGAEVEQPIAAVPGGVLVRDASNRVLGAVGVSGASADEDEHLAVVAANAVPGLVTEPAVSPLA